MTIAYPPFRPTDLTLIFGQYPIPTHGFQGVWELPTIAGSIETDIRLDVAYVNAATADAVELLEAWQASGGGLVPFTSPLPAQLTAGVTNADLAAYIRDPQGLMWVMAEPPDHQAVKANRATVRVSLVAELR